MSWSSYDRGIRRTVDWKLVICYLVLVLFGWLNIYASIHTADTATIFEWGSRSGKQFIWMMISFGVAALVLFVINPKLWEVISSPSYLLVFILLIAVIFVGGEVKGSKSWFVMGPVSFQPAEISKITTALTLAMIMSQQGFSMARLRNKAIAAAVVLLPMVVIVAEKETGSALVYLAFLFALYREGLSGWIFFVGFMAVLLFILTMTCPIYVPFIVLGAVVLAYYIGARMTFSRTLAMKRRTRLICLASLLAGSLMIFSSNFIFEKVLQDHQRKRVEVLLGLKDDPMGIGYNVNQSKIAIGSGGFAGKGFLHGTQTAYGFVPEQSTDFIFCTVGEEWGFLGCLFVICLYVFLIYRIVHDANESRETFTRIYGYCVAGCFFMHMFINIGMTIGLMPVIGIPLPFMSYGGSSLLGFTLMLFIFIALNRQEKRYF